MNRLLQEIREMIAENGPISLELYMKLALTHPVHGYYRTKMPIGAAGDFITAPEVHQMFGELIGLWAAEVWRQMGAPASVRLVELGPGRGTLMADALRAARVLPAFLAALDVHLVETSAPLMALQRAALADCGRPVAWHALWEDVPDGPAIVIANEFFDALPVRHYISDGAHWYERLIGLAQDGALSFGRAAEPADGLMMTASPGTIIEIGVAAQEMMEKIAARLVAQGGALLAIDYGHGGFRFGESLQAMAHHRFVDPLQAPGEADLTAHVDFAALAAAAHRAGAESHAPVTQGAFLSRLGVFERAAQLRDRADQRQRDLIEAALDRLARPGPQSRPGASMAELFKVLAVTAPGLPLPPGFEV